MSFADATPQTSTQARSSSLTAPSSNSSPSATSRSKDAPIFEFTKRKRWADLLITELSEAIILVLSATGQVWYCGAAITDLLGWNVEELVDGDLVDLMNVDDRTSFRSMFAESVNSKQPLLAYSRLQCKNSFYMASDYSSRPREVLFEITGYLHVLQDTGEFQCFFAMAKPYPSRNTAMLNTFLELKMENERFQQRLVHLRAEHSALEAVSSHPEALLQRSTPGQPGGDVYYGSYDENGSGSAGQSTSSGTLDDSYGQLGVLDDDGEAARKKLKRSYSGAEQYVCVTCGRTDSPEWRKGPLGPKTLCNACGLRWAKKVRTDKSGQLESEGDAGSASGSGSVIF